MKTVEEVHEFFKNIPADIITSGGTCCSHAGSVMEAIWDFEETIRLEQNWSLEENLYQDCHKDIILGPKANEKLHDVKDEIIEVCLAQIED